MKCVSQGIARSGLSVLVFVACVMTRNGVLGAEPKTELLWPQGAPGAKGDRPADKPTLTIYLPDAAKANGTAVVICPGGGYGFVAIDHEGHAIARWLNSLGAAGFIVDYRHRQKGYGHPAPLQDAQRAIRTVRARATEWKINPVQIGVIGFSAGGHLASTTGTHFDRGSPDAEDPIERASCRPDFMILCYPVIAFDEPYTHRGSQQNLLGKDADPKLVKSLSSEKQVTRDTPPTFLWHTNEDTGVPSENSVYFYLALRRAGVPGELHIYQHGQHGLGLAPKTPGVSAWPKDCEQWMRGLGMLGAKP
jgi:acetyl esterase/lipase